MRRPRLRLIVLGDDRRGDVSAGGEADLPSPLSDGVREQLDSLPNAGGLSPKLMNTSPPTTFSGSGLRPKPAGSKPGGISRAARRLPSRR